VATIFSKAAMYFPQIVAVPLEKRYYKLLAVAAAPLFKEDHMFGMYGGRLLANGLFFYLLEDGRYSNKGMLYHFKFIGHLSKKGILLFLLNGGCPFILEKIYCC
jgi:hypothetical protein